MQFLDMGNYGFYVWTAYGVTALVLAVETVSVVLRWREADRAANDGADTP